MVCLCIAFSASAATLNITYIGEGSVDPPVGVHSYGYFSSVTITATPAPGWAFSHWEGSLAGYGASVRVRMNVNRRTTAVFVPQTPTPDNSLARYVGKHDPNYSWYEVASAVKFLYTEYVFHLNSQQWRDASEVDRPLWEHEVQYIDYWFSAPECVFLIDGGSNPPDYDRPDEMFALACAIIGVDFADLKQVPNEPLYFTDEVNRRRTEDEILAYSLDKYLDTGDDEWPVHQAMVKAAVRGMDMVQEKFIRQKDFLLVGASKRGWATWLTAAVDPRVDAFVPIVIDVLNMDLQVEHFWEAYGFYQPAVADYVEFDLFCRVQEPSGQNCLKIIDPYEYIDDGKFTQPKLILNATGDQFFLPDGSQFYWDALPGPKWLRYLPNADHGIQNNPDYQEEVVIDSILAADTMMDNPNDMPDYSWSFEADGSIRVQCIDQPDAVRLWQGTNPDARDFRIEAVGEIFTSTPLSDQGGGVYIGYCPPPAQGWTAFLVELDYADEYGGEIQYTTEVRITPDVLPYEGTACMD
ncbi:MAG: PhoPQ-activated protein PqaA family protein [Candidatus Hydrogenedentes bacterium]|nr:PhoPQ-activated protein PqaA family protein [Candidatus Hydrogenedentota bacterium]